jgi:antirestriction protein ArdC
MTYPYRPTIEQLRQSVLTLADAVRESGTGDATFQRYLRFFATFHNLSVGNRLLVMQQRPTATWTKGFKAWKQVGRSVKRGERGIWIYAPVSGRRVTQIDPETGEEETREWTAYKSVPVWDVAQTVGGEWNPPNYTSDLGPQVAPLSDALWAYAATLGLSVSSRTVYGSVNGYLSPSERQIVINAALPVGIAVRTLTHEIIHSLLWQQHEAEDLPRGVQELETEATAAVVWMRLGYPQVAVNSGAYIASWAGDRSAPLILRSLERIVSTASTVLDGIRSNMPAMEIRYV